MVAVYILGKGSLYYNEELRYSLRSLSTFAPEIKRVLIVGEKPNFINDKIEYHYVNEAEGNKEYRIAMKICHACKIVDSDFIFMNDDFFLTRAQNWNLNYAKETLNPKGHDHYQKSILDTRDYLLSLECSTFNFDVHTPIVYNSKKFLDLMPHFEKSRVSSNGMVVKSLYGNIYGLEPTSYNDCKLSSLQTYADFNKIIDVPIISCSDGAWMNGVRSYMRKQFPNKSIYES